MYSKAIKLRKIIFISSGIGKTKLKLQKGHLVSAKNLVDFVLKLYWKMKLCGNFLRGSLNLPKHQRIFQKLDTLLMGKSFLMFHIWFVSRMKDAQFFEFHFFFWENFLYFSLCSTACEHSEHPRLFDQFQEDVNVTLGDFENFCW